MSIRDNTLQILGELPGTVLLEAACKMRTPDEIQQAVDAGVRIIGENYVQEAEEAYSKVKGDIRWHFIGHLQRNKVIRAVKVFDLIESLDSLALAKELNKQCAKTGKVMECMIEVNSGREKNKFGVLPEDVESLADKVKSFKNIKVVGLMTMGPANTAAEDLRPYFRITREIFDELKKKVIPNCEMKYLSMGMSDSYKAAVEEGANIVRIGTSIFGPRG
ncbi:MAG: YggS family pyridoxal phosphate-dependent enzyme [Elusimicrobia bacterium]|nr:YggS family pyridoxal phosphate-dependent enzyme [Elusimicrobiota bacterium]